MESVIIKMNLSSPEASVIYGIICDVRWTFIELILLSGADYSLNGIIKNTSHFTIKPVALGVLI
jgi:hypothetical protein